MRSDSVTCVPGQVVRECPLRWLKIAGSRSVFPGASGEIGGAPRETVRVERREEPLGNVGR